MIKHSKETKKINEVSINQKKTDVKTIDDMEDEYGNKDKNDDYAG